MKDVMTDAAHCGITRGLDLRRHGFGFGVHSCIGAPLARLEARTPFRTLARQVSRIELSGLDAVCFTPGHAISLGPTRLSVKVSGVLR